MPVSELRSPTLLTDVKSTANRGLNNWISDRGTFQGIGIVSDTESFLRELTRALHL